MANQPPGQTLQPTALVHEAWLRLVGGGQRHWNSRGHFFAAAAEAMRRILIEAIRRKQSQQRGGNWQRIELDESTLVLERPASEMLDIDAALKKLGREDTLAADLVKLRYFVGLTIPEAVEPAVDLATGDEIFLLTPDNAPLPSTAVQRAHAPLYLVLYPGSSTIPASSLNCTPTNCGHLQSWPAYSLLGHDHLVGVPHTGDFNVVWDVILVSFTTKGLGGSAIDTRILTLTQLDAAVANGDVVKSDVVLSFNCSITSITTYLQGTPLSFTVP